MGPNWDKFEKKRDTDNIFDVHLLMSQKSIDKIYLTLAFLIQINKYADVQIIYIV